MQSADEILNDIGNWYDEFDGRGENPREFDLEDLDVRRRGKEFQERQKLRAALDEERNKAIERWKKKC